MIQVNEELIRKVAELARLELENGEISEYAKSIGDVLAHVDQLSKLDTKGVEPMVYGCDDNLRTREDVAKPFPTDEDGKPKILKCAPEVLYDGFKVPPML